MRIHAMPSSLRIFWFYLINSIKNLLMLFIPGLIIRIRKPSGTGNNVLDRNLIASVEYSKSVFEKYLRFLDIQNTDSFLRGKTILEIGPGDSLTVAFLFLACGAKKVICLDRFPLARNIKKNSALTKTILQQLPSENRKCLQKIVSFDSKEKIVWDNSRLIYCCSKKKTMPAQNSSIDIVVSNAVLEHIPNLDAMFCELKRIMKPGSLMVHAADLGPHQMSIKNPLDFLMLPGWAWKLITSHRGAPNRARKSCYEKLLKKYSFNILKMQTTESFEQKHIDALICGHPGKVKVLSRDDLAARSILFSAKV